MEVYSEKVECKVSAKRMWVASFVDVHNFLPKCMPESVSHVTYEGPALQPGSFRIIHTHKSYAERIAKETNQEHLSLHTKEKFIEVDEKSLKIKSKTVEGGLVGVLVKSFKQTFHFEEGATPNTCVVHVTYEYEALSEEHQPKIAPTLKQLLHVGFKQAEEYLLSHDDYKEA